jgi:hypothetical protein
VQHPIISFLSGPNILPNTLFPSNPSLFP